MHTLFINDFIQLIFLRHISNNQVFFLRKNCTCSYAKLHASVSAVWSTAGDPDIDQTACTSLPEDEHLVVRNMSTTI